MDRVSKPLPVLPTVLRALEVNSQPRLLPSRSRQSPTATKTPLTSLTPTPTPVPTQHTSSFEPKDSADVRIQSYSAAQDEGFKLGKEAGEQAGYEDGYEQGYEQGYQAGQTAAVETARAHAEQLLETRVQQLDQILENLQQQRSEVLQSLEDDVIEIAFGAVCKMMGEVVLSRAGIAQIVIQALAQLRASNALAIRISPKDLSWMQEDPHWETVYSGRVSQNIQWIADERVQCGGCIIDTPAGSLDARLEVQFQELRDLLLRVRQERLQASST